MYLVGLLLQYTIVIGQKGYEDIIPPSPTAASLGTYGELPVNLYTGNPSIEIPIYQLKGRELSLPISLSYNASGIRVEENASWVGLGWALNAGDVITRNVRDKADQEATSTGMIPQRLSLPLLTDNLSQQNTTFSTLQNASTSGSTNYDFEPDVFNYNFMGMSGSFVFDNTGKPKFNQASNYKVTFGNSTGFTIITDDGAKYEFSQVERTNGTITSWYLTKITSPTAKDYINFIYQDEAYGYYQAIKYTKSISPLGTSVTNSDGSTSINYNSSLPRDEGAHIPNKISIDGKRLSEINFEGVGTISFVPAASPRVDLGLYGTINTSKALSEIQIKDLNNVIIKFYKFGYENLLTNSPYLGPNTFCPLCPATGATTNHLNYRMYLKKITEKSGGAVSDSIPPYEFEYLDRLPNGNDRLPHKMSAAQDHWGFFNGKDQNGMDLWQGFCGPFGGADSFYNLEAFCVIAGTESLPFWTIGGADRSPDATYIQASTLNKIKYPTGGISEFIFEPHKYDFIGSPSFGESIPDAITGCTVYNPIGGGLRIKEIISNTLDQTSKRTKYFYEEGVLKAKPHYYSYFFYDCSGKKQFAFQDCTPIGTGSSYERRLLAEVNSGAVNDQGYRGGANVGYGKVIEKVYSTESSGRIVYNGSTVYQYRTEHTDPTDASTYSVSLKYIFKAGAFTLANISLKNDYVFPYFPGRNLDWRHGQLLTKTVKNETDQVVYDEVNEYSNVVLNEIPAAKVFVNRADKDYFFLNYSFVMGWPKLISQKKNTYDRR
ncbi:hypothetical protein SAMN04515674_1058 [Pseudarcicella hirudinis]|uniref:YD repeat-containing protein n=1 Tax=Pseudarcicella hirudinis TaxID=1079859 RepID=A0A1I5SFR1_9BACT|nr:hypothetical protein [Pseudarcicella hirudinis]SFP69588.1 hypothetical protein SAMN04515674_1058 [Pseudarcicella hirudinis]